ncbi:MAG TPA: hypothetical protein VGJ20_00055 [Xanthobacteraceae bacterium]
MLNTRRPTQKCGAYAPASRQTSAIGKIAKEIGVGSGTVQRIKRRLAAWAAKFNASMERSDTRKRTSDSL